MSDGSARLVRSEKHTYRVLGTLGSGLQGKVKRGVCLETDQVRQSGWCRVVRWRLVSRPPPLLAAGIAVVPQSDFFVCACMAVVRTVSGCGKSVRRDARRYSDV
jgi:hypothetical protein